VAYGGFVGYKTYKEDAAFKPYKQLAIELNNSLGGGLTMSEQKHCSIEGTTCPIINLIMPRKENTESNARSDYDLFVSKSRISYGSSVEEKGCYMFKTGLQCNSIVSLSDRKLKVVFESSVDKSEISVSKL